MKQSEFSRIMLQAIDAETEAHEFYQALSEIAEDPSVKQIYREFAAEELEQRTLLEQLLKHDVRGFSFNESDDYEVSKTIDRPRLSPDLEPADAIALAMKIKEEAIETYSSLAELAADPEKQKVFDELAKMEASHKARMEMLYTNAAFPEVW